MRFLLIFLLIPIFDFAQYGIFFSTSFLLGSTQLKVGFAVNAVYVYKNFQISSRLNYNLCKNSIGAPLKGREIQFNIATVVGIKNYETKNFLQHTYFQNFTQNKYALGYSLNFYFDKIGTSQRTGTILLQIKNVGLYSENDIFGQRASDKFRTGAFKLKIFDSIYTYNITAILWTPNPKNVPRVYDSLYPARWGYKDLTKQKFGKYSTGILSFGLQYLDYQFNIGYESEWIRYFIQDKFIHDMYFVPKWLNKARNPHYPMVSLNGEAFLFKKGQKVKKGKFYWLLEENGSLFY